MKFVVLAFCVLFLVGCSGRNVIEQENRYVQLNIENNPAIKHYHLNVDGHTLHYAANGDHRKPALIIVHGTPGSWRQYSRYLLNETLLSHYYMIVIDRPGWGESVLVDDLNIASFELQAQIIAGLANTLRQQSGGQPVVLMGHSLGASIVPRVAMDFPDLIDGLLLFAGTLDPDLSSPRWFNYMGRIPMVKYVIGDSLHLSNQEIFALKKNIAAMKGRWHEIKAATISVQGMQDGLVYPANSYFIEKNFNASNTVVVRLDDEGHLFPMTLRDEVVAWACQVLEMINAKKSL